MRLTPFIIMALLFMGMAEYVSGQQGNVVDSFVSIPEKSIAIINSKLQSIDKKIDEQSQKVFSRFQKEEDKIKKKLNKIDSSKSRELFNDAKGAYENFKSKFSSTTSSLNQYVPSVDTLLTSLRFLEQNPALLSKLKDGGGQIKEAIDKVSQLKKSLESAEKLKQYMKERRQYLKEQLASTGLIKEMKKLDKTVFYYSQSIREYTSLLHDRKKAEAKLFAMLKTSSAFKKFMNRHSEFASLFGVPVSGSGSNAVSFAGLQTRASVQQAISGGMTAGNAQAFLQQQIRTSLQQSSQLRNSVQLPQWREDLGDNPSFKPNSQKTKTLLDRIEYGANVQFGRMNRFLPVSSEIAATLGYKLNDKGVIGIGSSYRLGLGNGLSHVKISHQGFGMRSYIDWKIKGGIYVSGGYEKNYLPGLNDLSPSQSIQTWQQSGLVGISKKYSISKKRKGSIQLLFDFLSYQNIPRSQPVVFRTGINF